MNPKNFILILSLAVAPTAFAANKPAKELPAEVQSWISRAMDCLEAWRNSGTGPDPDVWGTLKTLPKDRRCAELKSDAESLREKYAQKPEVWAELKQADSEWFYAADISLLGEKHAPAGR
jgi:hypothetical protein